MRVGGRDKAFAPWTFRQRASRFIKIREAAEGAAPQVLLAEKTLGPPDREFGVDPDKYRNRSDQSDV